MLALIIAFARDRINSTGRLIIGRRLITCRHGPAAHKSVMKTRLGAFVCFLALPWRFRPCPTFALDLFYRADGAGGVAPEPGWRRDRYAGEAQILEIVGTVGEIENAELAAGFQDADHFR